MTRFRHPQTRWLLRGVLAASLAGSGALIGLSAPAAHADSPLLSYTAQSDANTVDILVDTAAGLSGFHPLSEADIPEASSDYETGPSGRAFTSIIWPGAAAGNVGSLAGAFGLPSQLAPLADHLNDPMRAEATYPAGHGDVTYPGGNTAGVAEMHSHADANKTTASAAFADLTSPLFNVQGLQGSSSGSADSAARSTANGSFSGFSLLGGLVTVGASSSTATATSDGVSPKGQSTTHIGALTVLGHQVSIGSDGLIIGPVAATGLDSLLAPTEQTVASIISALNLKITALPQVISTKQPAASVTSGGLQITFALPSQLNLNVDCAALNALPQALQQVAIICTLPGLLTGANVTITLARVNAQAVASPPFDISGLSSQPSSAPSTAVPVTTGSSAPPVSTSSGAETGVLPGGGGGTTSGLLTTPTGPAPQVAEPAASAPPTQQVALSKPVGSGILIGLLLLAALAGGVLLWTSTLLEAAPGAACPLEDPLS